MKTSSADMKITAIAPWFGSKRTLAPIIVEELGRHSAYWEPFCGSMAVLLAKPESGHETVNDLHGDLINLARVIQHETLGPALYRKLRRVLVDELLRDEILSLPATDDQLERAYRYFVVSWFGRNGFCGTVGVDKSSFAVRFTLGGGHGGLRFANVVQSIPAFRRRLRRVTILNRDALEILDKIDDVPTVAIYVDPPYLKKAADYVHDFDWLTHRKLAKALSRFVKARVVVSYYEHFDLESMYPRDRWTRRDCTIEKGIQHAGKRGPGARRDAPEVLLINGPSYAQGGKDQNNADKPEVMLVKNGVSKQ